MSRFSDRGYCVLENGPVYTTPDMEKTIEWFERVLGWWGQIDSRNDKGEPGYGSVFSLPPEVELSSVAPYTGIHLFPGEPRQGAVCFMKVSNIKRLRACVLSSGWERVTPIEHQPWGSYCTVTTLDGSEIKVFSSAALCPTV